MKTKFYQIVFVCLALVGITSAANAQTIPGSYDPFTTTNVNALVETKIVTEDSYHTYTYTGDVNLTGSTFVFKVVGGTIVDAIGNPAAATLVETNGTGTHSVSESANTGSIIVQWGAEDGTQKYVAVYELTSTSCIVTDQIQGFKVTVGSKPTLALALTDLEACSTDLIPIDITVTNGTSPWEVVINDGTDDKTFYFSTDADLSAISGYDVIQTVVPASGTFTYNWGASGYLNTNTNGADVTYVFTAQSIDDAVTKLETNDTGIIVSGSESVTSTVHPLPVVGTMAQD